MSFVPGMCFAAKRSFSTIAEPNEVPKVIDMFHVENRDFKRYRAAAGSDPICFGYGQRGGRVLAPPP